MVCLPVSDEQLERAAALLRTGGIVAFPTETVYGLGAVAFDGLAVARIFEIKARPRFDPLIVHVADRQQLAQCVIDVPPVAERLIAAFWPGPLTLVLRKCEAIGSLLTGGLATVAVRMPSHPVARALLERTGSPIAAPSANPFGGLSPTRAEHVAAALGDRVDMILDGGPTEYGLESSIILIEPTPTLLRHGAIPVEQIEAVIGPVQRDIPPGSATLAPGRLPHHYAPHTPLRLIAPERVPMQERTEAASLAFRRVQSGYRAALSLSPSGDLRIAAAHLFDALHRLDAAGATRIDVEPVPESGLGSAIMDRLTRGSAR
ncbi:MAG: L-threonylcarbamoyladenylate synthase [Bacillati bacterium]